MAPPCKRNMTRDGRAKVHTLRKKEVVCPPLTTARDQAHTIAGGPKIHRAPRTKNTARKRSMPSAYTFHDREGAH